ncbi:hypothetical protein BJ138DRAFT_1151375 [Hygrophoropsis aurantiaca]|uniref:Uncharacterized protein n=1 Tax=Hygrophoropsis aurantiaca TaxID=72124 RepID=A0ACB8ACA4_9AGAM|nr:hypothetical protein BJ138DRAFT_1151375 [Hygrophoropsis aurantiaca]
MAALYLHHALFTSDTPVTQPASAAPLLTPASNLEQPSSPISPTCKSPAYLDLIARQPTHPDGPQPGWDLGLNLLGDHLTAAECKSLEERFIKRRLRRLQAATIALELALVAWAVYSTIRYCLTLATTGMEFARVPALALGITSAIATAFLILSLLSPLFPVHTCIRAWAHSRTVLRLFSSLLLLATTIANIVLVGVWHPANSCGWDIDVVWTNSPIPPISERCSTAFSAWIGAAVMRFIVTLAIILLYLFTVRAYYFARHPSQMNRTRRDYQPSFVVSNDDSPMSIFPTSSSSRLQFMRSKNTLVRSSSTLGLTNSSSTLAPSLSASIQSHPYSNPSTLLSHYSLASANPYRPTSNWIDRSVLPPDQETSAPSASQNQNRSGAQRSLRRMSRISTEQLALHAGVIPRSEESGSYPAPSPTSEVPESNPLAVSSEYSGSSEHDTERSERNIRSGLQVSGSSNSGTDTKTEIPVYSYGYGSTGPTYPYLSVYNSQERFDLKDAEIRDCEVASPQPRHSITSPVFPELPETPELVIRDENGDEDDCIPIMGGFVRRMATIESLGSREAASLSAWSSYTRRSQTPASQISSLRFATYTPSLSGSSASRSNSLNNAYASIASNGTIPAGRVSERGELLADGRMASPLSYSRYYYSPGSHRLSVPLEEEER